MLSKYLKIYYQNVRGLNTNSIEVRQQIINNDYDIYIFTETWLNSGCFDSEIFESGYEVYRRDRETASISNSVRGGGVLIAVSKRLVSKRIQEWESECEDLWISITALDRSGKSSTSIRLCAVYLPPPVTDKSLKTFTDKVSCNVESHDDFKYTVIAGDFNMSSIVWNTNTDNNNHCDNNYATPSGYENRELLCNFIDFITLNGMKQYNCVKNKQDKVLDLVLCNEEVLQISECMYPVRNIDNYHPALDITMKTTNASKKKMCLHLDQISI